MMKNIILSIGLVSTINASQRLLQQTTCAQVRCGNGDYCTEDPIAGAQCVSCAATLCQVGQTCVSGIGCTDSTTAGPTLPPGCALILCEQGNTCCDDGNGNAACCPICTGDNEEYSFCGSACPAVCGVDGPDACITLCVQGCFCADGFIRDTNGDCISEDECNAGTGSETCPLRCEGGYDGCNTCGCDRLGNPTFCTKRGCIGPIPPAECRSCEIGYTLNTDTNTCDSAKVSCRNNNQCDSGFRCRKDPECREYSDLACSDTGRVCVTRRGLETPCTSESDCDTENGFGCLMGDRGDGRCVKYQTPP